MHVTPGTKGLIVITLFFSLCRAPTQDEFTVLSLRI